MIRGLYSAASGMGVQQARVESISSNLANASTPGYKKEELLVRSFPELLLVQQGGPRQKGRPDLPGVLRQVGAMGTGAMVFESFNDLSPGLVRDTGNPGDIYLEGPGFLAVKVNLPGGSVIVGYTRNGMLKVDQEGYLTLGDYRVLGQTGEIKVVSADFKVAADGTVEAAGKVVDRLRVMEFGDPQKLVKLGEGIFSDPRGEAGPAVSTSVRQGFLEGSNVNVVDEMVDLITVTRTYEANQRLIQAHDEILAKAVTQVGSLR